MCLAQIVIGSDERLSECLLFIRSLGAADGMPPARERPFCRTLHEHLLVRSYYDSVALLL